MARVWGRLAWAGALLLSAAALAQSTDTVNIAPRTAPRRVEEPQPLLRVDTSLVLLPVHVTNALGGPVTDLGRESFRILEDGIGQTISSFCNEDTPVSIGLLFDSSGSMRGKMEKTAETATAFFQAANPQDEFFLVQFNDRARMVVPFTQDASAMFARLSHTKPYGRTSLVDAVFLALQQIKKGRYSRRALVILSDGGDNWSRHSVRELKEALLESDVLVYAMGIFEPAGTKRLSAEERNGPALLNELTEQSGGRHFPVSAVDQLPAISRTISRELHNEYVLGFYSTNPARDGKYRNLSVKLAAPDGQQLRISFRRGYYAPAE